MTLTFEVNIEVIHVHVLTQFHDPICYSLGVMNYLLVFFNRQKAMHKSQSCISTGGLKNCMIAVDKIRFFGPIKLRINA